MEGQNNSQTVVGALGYPVALPQSIIPVTNTKTTTQRTQYDPQKLQALMTALNKPRALKSRGEIIAEALANVPEARTFTGGFGEEIVDPFSMALSSFARGFGNAYKAKKEDERERANEAREDAIKAAQFALEADKQQVAKEIAVENMKFNDPKAKTFEQLQNEQVQKQAAVQALHTLADLAEKGGIYSGNNETSDWWLTGDSSKNIGRREQALSTLVPMTAKVAHDAGISGINSVGEAMLYLGIPANATSAQIKGALPGIIKKLGLESEYYQMSPVNNGMAF